MFEIAKWYNNYQAPSVLMIDDLSDAYIDIYKEKHKNDWGYLCNDKDSAYMFLDNNLLVSFPKIKITFFVPYLKHNVIHNNTKYSHYKFSIGERKKFTLFLKGLVKKGHEISHHGSNHGEYIHDDPIKSDFKHEWELFKSTEDGVATTRNGIEVFKETLNINISGGKFCGYMMRGNSLEIIDKCDFLYWSDKVNYLTKDYKENFFGENNIILFPTNYPGNSFIRLSYKTGNKKRDMIKNVTRFFQPFYNIISYYKLYKLYTHQDIISIQEHYSPSTTRGRDQSLNIVTDIKSLNKIYTFLGKLSIWYATCEEIAQYIYVRENSIVNINNTELVISFTNKKNLSNASITLINTEEFILSNSKKVFKSVMNNKYHVINLPINNEKNIFNILRKDG